MATSEEENVDGSLRLQALWDKYEDIAMHFNDLLMRLRSQGLAGIAAVSTLFGIFGRADNGSLHTDWLIGTGLFTAAAIFWVAIWCLDFLYYNRLLLGAVAALAAIEEESRSGNEPSGIYMSTMIEAEFTRPLGRVDGLSQG